MASHVKQLGTYQRYNSSNTQATVTLTATPSPGSAVIVHTASTQQLAASAIDSKGNAYALAKAGGGSVASGQLITLQNVAPLVAGDTITITFAGSVSTCAIFVQEYSGITATSPVDRTANVAYTATTARTSGTTSTTNQAHELVVATFAINVRETGFTPGAGYSAPASPYYGNDHITVETEHQDVTSTGTYSATATGGVTADGSGIIVTYKAVVTTFPPISGGISAPSQVGGTVGVRRKFSGAAIFAFSTVSGGLGAAGGGDTSTDPDAYGSGEYGVAEYGGSVPTGGGDTGGGGGGGGTPPPLETGQVQPNQPTIIASAPPSDDPIVDFIESSPPGLFPENDESNFGFIIRRIWCDRITDLIAQQDLLYNNRFITTADEFLDEWERQEGVPADPATVNNSVRKDIVLGRLRKGPFTRTMRKEIVERYLSEVISGGTPVTFTSTGIPLTAAGLKLYGGGGSLSTAYKIVEDVANFAYHIYILNIYTVSAGMQRELSRVTPAGISFDINYVASLP